MKLSYIKTALCFCVLNVCYAPLIHARPIDFDCDVPPDKFSSIAAAVSGPNYVVTGTITAIEKRSGRYLPLVGILIKRLDRPNTFGGFQIIPANGDKFRLMFRKHGTDNDANEAVDNISLEPNTPFRLSVAADGAMSLTLSGKDYAWSLGADFKDLREAKIQAMCSTGQFKFFGLELSAADAGR